jgi:hypothetical protein
MIRNPHEMMFCQICKENKKPNGNIAHLLAQQGQRLVEIQEIKMDLMEDLARKTPRELGG